MKKERRKKKRSCGRENAEFKGGGEYGRPQGPEMLQPGLMPKHQRFTQHSGPSDLRFLLGLLLLTLPQDYATVISFHSRFCGVKNLFDLLLPPLSPITTL